MGWCVWWQEEDKAQIKSPRADKKKEEEPVLAKHRRKGVPLKSIKPTNLLEA
jgi:hypothetical protein